MDYKLDGGLSKMADLPHSVDKISTTDEEEDRHRNFCSCGICVLMLTLVACGVGCFIMLSTNLFNSLVQKNLTLRNNSFRFEAWRRPPVHASLKVYIFNYTNIQQFEERIDDKLKIEELGPYTYIETLERVNITYNENGTLTYRDKKMYKFSEELSNGSESDRIFIPNIPFMGAVSHARDQSFITKVGILGALRMMGASPFINLPVGELLWGYDDVLASVTSHILSFKYHSSVPVFGILAAKNQTQEDAITIFTGEDDVTQTGIITLYGAKSSLDYWKTPDCNRIDGTDGTIYPPSATKNNSTLYLYVKDMCRRMPMVYESSKVNPNGIPVVRYHLARDVFENGNVNLENNCFCNHGHPDIECMPSGVFNVSPCAFGGPIITSLPHFLYGDPSLSRGFEGLSPHSELHESFVEIDSKFGIPVSGKSRFQLNVMYRKAGSSSRAPYEDKLILPVSWMDYGFDNLPEDVSAMMYNLLLFIDVAEICLSFSFFAAMILSAALIIRKLILRRRSGLFGRNLDLSTADMPLVVCPGKT